MRRFPELQADPWALLGLAAFWFFDGQGVFGALIPAVILHETGHWLALRWNGARLRRLRLAPGGLVMDYDGALSAGAEALCALAGPAFGLLWAGLAAAVGGSFLLRSAGASLCLTVFNLLPILPLDGGRTVAALAGDRTAIRLGRVLCVLLLSAGALAGLCGHGAVFFLSALMLSLLFRSADTNP